MSQPESNIARFAISVDDINQRTLNIIEVLNGTSLPNGPTTAIGLINLGVFILRTAACPPETVEMIAKLMLSQYEHLPNSGLQGKVAAIEDVPIMAKGNDTIN